MVSTIRCHNNLVKYHAEAKKPLGTAERERAVRCGRENNREVSENKKIVQYNPTLVAYFTVLGPDAPSLI